VLEIDSRGETEFRSAELSICYFK